MATKNLYVIRLDDAVAELPKFRRANPGHVAGKPCMYVGVTSHDPKTRFQQHKNGYKASRIARKYGRYLMWRKSRHLNPIESSEAERREWQLANELRGRGYGGWQN